MPNPQEMAFSLLKQTFIRYLYSSVTVTLFFWAFTAFSENKEVTAVVVVSLLWGAFMLWFSIQREVKNATDKQDGIVTVAAFMLSATKWAPSINKCIMCAIVYNMLCYLPVFFGMSIGYSSVQVVVTIMLFILLTASYWWYQYNYLIEKDKETNNQKQKD